MIYNSDGHVLSIEEFLSKTFDETEHRFYGRVETPAMLRGIPYVDIEQWGYKVTDTSQVTQKLTERVRQTTKDGVIEYSSCKKIGTISNERTINRDEFLFLKSICTSGQVKRRYSFYFNGMNRPWELDLYKVPNKDGYYKWATLELEVSDLNAPLPEMPDMFLSRFDNRDKSRSTQSAISDLYDKYYIFKK